MLSDRTGTEAAAKDAERADAPKAESPISARYLRPGAEGRVSALRRPIMRGICLSPALMSRPG
jgi:hypothetical protein